MSKKTNIEDRIEMLDAKINHIEDATVDNRDLMIKLVKQSNEIVRFLSKIEIEPISDDGIETISLPEVSNLDIERSNRLQSLKELLDDFMDKHKEMKEFEEELQKYKDELTPGQIGES